MWVKNNTEQQQFHKFLNESFLPLWNRFWSEKFFFSRDPWKRKMTEMSVGITIISTIQYEQSKQYQWKQVIKKITKKKSHYATLPTSFNGILVKGVFFSEILRDRNARVSQLTLHKQQQTFRNNATKPWTNSSYLFWLDLVRTGGVLPRSLETERQQWQTQYSATFPQASLHGHIPFYLPLFYFGGGVGKGGGGCTLLIPVLSWQKERHSNNTTASTTASTSIAWEQTPISPTFLVMSLVRVVDSFLSSLEKDAPDASFDSDFFFFFPAAPAPVPILLVPSASRLSVSAPSRLLLEVLYKGLFMCSFWSLCFSSIG